MGDGLPVDHRRHRNFPFPSLSCSACNTSTRTCTPVQSVCMQANPETGPDEEQAGFPLVEVADGAATGRVPGLTCQV